MAVIHQKIADLAPAREFAPRVVPSAELASGMIVRAPNWLGDAVMTLPAIQSLRELLGPDARLVVIAPPGVAEFFRMVPAVSSILAIPAHSAWNEDARAAIRKLGITTGILFTNSLRDTWQLRQCGVKHLYGKSARCRGFLLKRSFSFPGWKKGVLNESHHALENLSMVLAMGGKRPEPLMGEICPRLRLDQLKLKWLDFCQHPKLLVLAPGAAYGAAKRWSSESFRAVAADWIGKGGIVIIVGAPAEREIGEEVAKDLPKNKIFNLSGETKLPELYHLLASARACVANDSGIMHLAAAIGTPGVAVFGPTDYRATGPITDRWMIVFEKEKCAPCFERVCSKGNPRCIQKITPDEVIAALNDLLKTC